MSDVGIQHRGPMDEYEARVHRGDVREDEHQVDIIQSLQHLHDELRDYVPPKVQHPPIESLLMRPKPSFLGSLLGRQPPPLKTQIPENEPKGLYLFGDVGSGKTMLMDLFYDTLPANITSKTRIHFHHFMQDVHRRAHMLKVEYGNDFDAIPYIAADLAQEGSVLCFDEFQVTDIVDAMILRRLFEFMMSHGVVLVATSNRHPSDLYKNGLQRESFLPCIALLKTQLHIINLDSPTDYRKIPRPPSGVYHFPLDKAANSHAEKWFKYLGDFEHDPPHTAVHEIWGRDVVVPRASGMAAQFTFKQLCGSPTGAADFLELMRWYHAFIVTDIPAMTLSERDLARRFITFIDAIYESHAKLVLTSAKNLSELFASRDEIDHALEGGRATHHGDTDTAMRSHTEDREANVRMLKKSSLMSNDEELFAFARALSRLTEMGTEQWIERGLGLESKGGKAEMEKWKMVRSAWRVDHL